MDYSNIKDYTPCGWCKIIVRESALTLTNDGLTNDASFFNMSLPESFGVATYLDFEITRNPTTYQYGLITLDLHYGLNDLGRSHGVESDQADLTPPNCTRANEELAMVHPDCGRKCGKTGYTPLGRNGATGGIRAQASFWGWEIENWYLHFAY
ncbi:hypothetical protein PRIPAC_89292 [Pristionchus pacificus]|uniref:Uncharacterized protein n=1 Tax=Pristionchus pacificus TaxID=54126 RepID=A0A2A6B3M4_PRIPA|nr:hypothetical protein PRIPAC_89292 [Pristionchus pacificus]|eukprot:PDM60477.1 hypothetical protein PRIPAC_53455 [Pristionchus pacificus]